MAARDQHGDNRDQQQERPGLPEQDDVAQHADDLRDIHGIDQVASFGNTLHVVGRDEQALAAAIAPFRSRSDLAWHKGETSLEDVFIMLMDKSRDNFA